MRLLMLPTLLIIVLLANSRIAAKDIELYDWFTTQGTVKEIVSPNYFILTNNEQQMLVQCPDHKLIVLDSVTVLGDNRGRRRAKMFAHIIFKEDTIYHLNSLKRFDTLSIPTNLISTPTNNYLYRYSMKVKADQKKTIAIGSLLGVTSISLVLSYSSKRNRESSPISSETSTNTNNDKSSSSGSSDTTLDQVIEDLFDSIASASANPSSGFSLTTESKTILYSTLVFSGVITIVRGVVHRKRLARLPRLEHHEQPKVELSLQPGGTIREPGLFLVGTF